MDSEIIIIKRKDQIDLCYDAFKELRSHLEKDIFIDQVLRQKEQAYKIIAIKRGSIIVSAADFRLAEFLAWGEILYIDNLTTLTKYRGNGYAATLID